MSAFIESLEKISDQELKSVYKKAKQQSDRFDILQKAKKIQLNSAYGAIGSKYFRMYDRRLAEAVTFSGRVAVRSAEKCLNVFLNKELGTKGIDYVVFMHTDSVYVCLEQIVCREFGESEAGMRQVMEFLKKYCEQQLLPKIKSVYKKLAVLENAYENRMAMKLELIADVGIWMTKNRYVLNKLYDNGSFLSSPKIKQVGIESIKSNYPSVARQNLKKAIEIILRGSEKDLQAFVKNFKSEYDSMSIDDIAYPTGVSNVIKYMHGDGYESGTPQHVRACIIYNRLLAAKHLDKIHEKIYDGDKVKYVLLSRPNSINVNVIAYKNQLPKELDLEKYVDKEKMFEKTFLSPLQKILNVVGWQYRPTLSVSSFGW